MGKLGIVNDAKGIFEKNPTTASSYLSNIVETRPNGIEIKELIKPATPVKNPIIIVKGIKGSIRTLAGRATRDKLPILYKINGRTKIYAAKVTETTSRKPKRLVTQEKYCSILGAKNITATVAMNDN